MKVAQVKVLASHEMISVEIKDSRVETTGLFASLNEAQREQLAIDAWTIGLRALASAHTQAREARLEDVGKRLLTDIDRQLKTHIDQHHSTLSTVLAKYFDPKDGQVNQRLSAFMDDHGVLARVLDKYLAPHNSVLTETLARQVGESSPLFKKLSPTDSQGLMKILESGLQKVMNASHMELTRALDPLAENGAVARFLKSLRDELRVADADRAKQLSAALMALNANDESSLINRLVRETNQARQAVLSAVNPDVPESPMAIMKASLTTLLNQHAESQAERLQRQEDRQANFERDVREALTRIETKRVQNKSTPQGGLDFEANVALFVRHAVKGAPCIVDATGHTSGSLSRCKKGDLVVRFTEESAFSGSGVVIEAKRDASYSVQKALEELDLARKNRKACSGVFVMAKSHASEGFPNFARYGNNVIVIWDESDAISHSYLHAAILLGLALVSRSRKAGEQGDIQALQDIESRITNEVSRLEKMEKYNDSIRRSSDAIGDEIRKAHKQIDLLLKKAESTLKALNIEICDEEVEIRSPIMLPNKAGFDPTHDRDDAFLETMAAEFQDS